jgi:hypothetical protein
MKPAKKEKFIAKIAQKCHFKAPLLPQPSTSDAKNP